MITLTWTVITTKFYVLSVNFPETHIPQNIESLGSDKCIRIKSYKFTC